MSKEIEKKINAAFERVFNSVFDKSAMAALLKGDKTVAEAHILSLENSASYKEFAEKFSKELTRLGLKSNRGTWKKYYEAARRLHYVVLPKTYTAYEAKIAKAAISHNFKMIKSIPDKVKETLGKKYLSTLIEEVAKGSIPRGSFKSELESHGHKHAKLIARTETAKLQTAILEERATNLGSVAYEWLASNDSRTRPSHKAMNKVIVFWKKDTEKPELDGLIGNAGEYPNCRCTPQPIVDVSQLTKSNYKVYNYNTKKIITLTKHDLIEALTKGEL